MFWREQFQRQALPQFCPNCAALFLNCSGAMPLRRAEIALRRCGASVNAMRMKMNRARYRVVQDFLHVVMLGVVTGVLFSMAVTGVVFLISGHAYGG
jgi:hypothetical protein